MSWDHRVLLSKKRITTKTLEETYATMQDRYGRGIVDDSEDHEEGLYVFERFRFRLVRDAQAGLYFLITHEDVANNDHDVHDAGACMSDWAHLLGGEISEEQWNERLGSALAKHAAKHKVPRYGPADSVMYLAFDTNGHESSRKTIEKRIHGHVTPQILQPTWLVANAVVRLEYLSYDAEGLLSDHITYEVGRGGRLKQRSRS